MNYNSHIYTTATLPESLKESYGKERYHCFKPDDPYVNLNHEERVEFDQFDQLSNKNHEALYLMITADDPLLKKPRLVTAVRYLSCEKQYDLESESWRYLTKKIALPKSKNICEASRWIGKSSRTQEGMISSGMLHLLMVETAKKHGFDKMLGVTTTKAYQWMKKRNVNLTRISETFACQRDGAGLLLHTIDIDENFYNVGLKLLHQGLGLKAIEKISVNTQAA